MVVNRWWTIVFTGSTIIANIGAVGFPIMTILATGWARGVVAVSGLHRTILRRLHRESDNSIIIGTLADRENLQHSNQLGPSNWAAKIHTNFHFP